jgi:hypothetical protein
MEYKKEDHLAAENHGNEHQAENIRSAVEGQLSAGHFRVDGMVALVTGGGTGEPASILTSSIEPENSQQPQESA